jgi:hypothetical protein
MTAVVSEQNDASPQGKKAAVGGVVAGGVASAAGGVALGLGAVGAGVALLVAGPVICVGALAVFMARQKREQPPPDPDAATLAGLDAFVADTHGKVPTTVQARIDRIASTVRATIPRLDQLGSHTLEAHAVVRTATSYLPEAVAAYMRLPRDFADRRAVSGGKTALSLLCDQLDLLASKMDELFDAACRDDVDALLAHGRFLADKFATGALAIDPGKR